MTEEFTASNGISIREGEWGHYEYMVKNGTGFSEANRYAQGSPLDLAMAEYYRAKGDERLGRWRWPENPEWVLYPDDDGDVVALHEGTGESSSLITRITVANFPNTPDCKAAAAYFGAHPEPKPWKPGEVWLLTFREGTLPTGAYVAGGWSFVAADHAIPQDDPRITSTEKIYPLD